LIAAFSLIPDVPLLYRWLMWEPCAAYALRGRLLHSILPTAILTSLNQSLDSLDPEQIKAAMLDATDGGHDVSFAVRQQVRANKTNEFMHHERALPNLGFAVILNDPVREYMNLNLRADALSNRYCHLLSKADPGLQSEIAKAKAELLSVQIPILTGQAGFDCVLEFISLMQLPVGADKWRVFGIRDVIYHEFFMLLLVSMMDAYRRLVWRKKQMPFPVFGIGSLSCPADVPAAVEGLSAKFCKCPKCRDRFGGPMLQALLADPPLSLNILQDTICALRTTSIGIERHHLLTAVRRQGNNVTIPTNNMVGSMQTALHSHHKSTTGSSMADHVTSGTQFGQLMRHRRVRSSSVVAPLMSSEAVAKANETTPIRESSPWNMFVQESKTFGSKQSLAKLWSEMSPGSKARYDILASEDTEARQKAASRTLSGAVSSVVSPTQGRPEELQIEASSPPVGSPTDRLTGGQRKRLRGAQLQNSVAAMVSDARFKGLDIMSFNSVLPPQNVNITASEEEIKCAIQKQFGFDRLPVTNPANPTEYTCGYLFGGFCETSSHVAQADIAVYNLHANLEKVKCCSNGQFFSVRCLGHTEFWYPGIIVRAPSVAHFCLKFVEVAENCVAVEFKGPTQRGELPVTISTSHKVFSDLAKVAGDMPAEFQVDIHITQLGSKHGHHPRFNVCPASHSFSISTVRKLAKHGTKRKLAAAPAGPALKLPFGLSVPSAPKAPHPSMKPPSPMPPHDKFDNDIIKSLKKKMQSLVEAQSESSDEEEDVTDQEGDDDYHLGVAPVKWCP
jgi:hypothetical protein